MKSSKCTGVSLSCCTTKHQTQKGADTFSDAKMARRVKGHCRISRRNTPQRAGEHESTTFKQVISKVYRRRVLKTMETSCCHWVYEDSGDKKGRATPNMFNSRCNMCARFARCVVHCLETLSTVLPQYSYVRCRFTPWEMAAAMPDTRCPTRSRDQDMLRCGPDTQNTTLGARFFRRIYGRWLWLHWLSQHSRRGSTKISMSFAWQSVKLQQTKPTCCFFFF